MLEKRRKIAFKENEERKMANAMQKELKKAKTKLEKR